MAQQNFINTNVVQKAHYTSFHIYICSNCSKTLSQTLVINPRRACAARVTVVCLSVSQHLTSGASVRLEHAVTYSTGDEGQKICGVFSETAPLQRYGTCCCTATHAVSHFYSAENAHAHI